MSVSDGALRAVPWTERIGALIELRRFDHAEAECRAALAEEPNSAEILHLFAASLHAQGKQKQALAAIKMSLAIAPDASRAHCLRAHILVKLPSFFPSWRRKTAMAAAQEALRLAPRDPDVLGLLAWLHNLSNKRAKAVETATLGLSIDPQNEECLLQHSQALHTKREWERAKGSVVTLLAANPDSPLAHGVGGVQALADGRFLHAAEHFRDASSFDPFDAGHRAGYVMARRAQIFGLGFFQRLSLRHGKNRLEWLVVFGVLACVVGSFMVFSFSPTAPLVVFALATGTLFLAFLYELAMDLYLASSDRLFRLSLPEERRRLACTTWTVVHLFGTCAIVAIAGGYGLWGSLHPGCQILPLLLSMIGFFPARRIPRKAWRWVAFFLVAAVVAVSLGFLVQRLFLWVHWVEHPEQSLTHALALLFWIFGVTVANMFAVAEVTKPRK